MSEMVSVTKARRILSSLSDTMSDDQVKEVVTFLHLLAKEHLWYNGSKVNEGIDEPDNPSPKA